MMNDSIQTIALRICDLREICGMTQEEVAAAAGIPLDMYREYEAGQRDFSFSHLFNQFNHMRIRIGIMYTLPETELTKFSG